jgi:hypothetical protein
MASTQSMAGRLERGEVIYFAQCPFPIPQGDDRQFLFEQTLGGRVHKNIAYDPASDQASGYTRHSAAQAERLRGLLAEFAGTATRWLGEQLPGYAARWELDRVSYRPAEEATRVLRLKARNDLMHVDAFPSRPTQGWRILRLFVNLNLTDPRIWVTSDPFARLLERFGRTVGLPSSQQLSLGNRLRNGLLRLFRPNKRPRTVYDSFMLKFHDFLKANEEFQERGPKRHWSFAPGSAWLAITDTCSHAVLRGRYALEHSYFLDPQSLALPDESPAALLARACGRPVLGQAA